VVSGTQPSLTISDAVVFTCTFVLKIVFTDFLWSRLEVIRVNCVGVSAGEHASKNHTII